MAYGLALVALGYIIIAFAVKGLGAGEKVSMWWLIGAKPITANGFTD